MLAMAAELKRLGHAPFVAARPASGFLLEARTRGMRCLPLRLVCGLEWIATLRLRAFLVRENIDGICVKNYKHARLAALARCGLPANILCRRGNNGDIRNTLRHRLTITRCADGVLVPSAALKLEFCRVAWLDPARVFVLRHEIDAHGMASVHPAEGLPDASCRVLFVGRLCPTKGTDILLQAWRIAQSRAPQARLLLVGETEGVDYRRMAADLGIAASVDFAGFQNDTKPWIAAADILVLPSRREGAGFVLLEAMARGIPCIGSQIGGIPEYIAHNETGLLTPVGQAQALAEALLDLINDPAKRLRLGAAGRRRAETCFQAGLAAVRFVEIFTELKALRR